MLNAGIVGFGVAGRFFHAPLISAASGMRVAAIVQRHGDEARAAYPEARIHRDFDALLGDPGIDLVVVATPNALHAPQAEAALTAGKHVVVDKPFTITSGEADRLIAVARETGRVLSVYQNRRWDADFLTLRRVIEAGWLGRVVEYEAHFDRFRPNLKTGAWRETDAPGGGILYDLGAHLIDQALQLFGLPETVGGDLRTQREGAAAPDYFHLDLGYPGVKVTLKAGMLVREAGPQFIVHGTRGSFTKYGRDPQEDRLRAGASPLAAGFGDEARERWAALDTEVDGLHVQARVESMPGRYLAYYENVRDAILAGAPLAVTPEQARDVIRVIEAAQRSQASRSAVALAPVHVRSEG